MSRSADLRYAQPGSLPFRLNARTTYAHDAHTLAASVASNFARADYCLYPCEPNWVYPICNHYGMASLVLHDRLFGTSDAKQNLTRWLHSLDTEFTDESGSVIGLRSELTGLRFPFPAGDAGFAHFASCWSPERGQRQWAVAHHELSGAIGKGADGRPRLVMPGAGFDFGNYRRGWAGTFASILAGAREFGDEQIAEAAERALEQDGQRTLDRGVAHYAAMSNLSNIVAVAAKLRRTGDFRRALTEGPAESALRGPLLADAQYPDVLVARAFSRGENLELVLYPGAAPGVQRLGLARLRPGAAYQVRGPSTERFVADASGEAKLDVTLTGRTALEIVPA
jgi:Linalool dehydratase/isomerase